MSNPFIKVTWEDVPENFTPEKIKRVKAYFQEKYSSKNVQVITKTLSNVNNTRLQSLEASDNILDPQCQKNLVNDFLTENQIDFTYQFFNSTIKSVFNTIFRSILTFFYLPGTNLDISTHFEPTYIYV